MTRSDAAGTERIVQDGEGSPDGTTHPVRMAAARAATTFGRHTGQLRDWGRRHRVLRRGAIGLVALIGATLAVALAGNVRHQVGPVRAQFALRPAIGGGTEVDVPPLGTLTMHSHVGPLHVRATVTGIDLAAAQRVLDGTVDREELSRQVDRDVRSALLRLALVSTAAALIGGAGLAALVFRTGRAVAAAAAVTAGALVVAAGITAVSWNTAALSQPRFRGLLASAPGLIGDIEDIRDRFDSYREELAKIVRNVSKLYNVASTLPTAPASDAIALLWVSDIHDNPEAFSVMRSLIDQFGVSAVVDTGDLSDHGTATENSLYAPIGRLGVPYVWVRGNHDSAGATQNYLAGLRNVRVLDNGAVTEVAGLRITGTGDPRFTPDRTETTDDAEDRQDLAQAGERLATTIRTASTPVDIALVHEPEMAPALYGHVPLVLDGHIHHRDAHIGGDTLELTQGSSGGAGLRNLEGDKPQPLEFSVLYLDPVTHRLVAVDDVTLSGLGAESVSIQRHSAASYRNAAPASSLSPSPSAPSSPAGSRSGSRSPGSAGPS